MIVFIYCETLVLCSVYMCSVLRIYMSIKMKRYLICLFDILRGVGRSGRTCKDSDAECDADKTRMLDAVIRNNEEKKA